MIVPAPRPLAVVWDEVHTFTGCPRCGKPERITCQPGLLHLARFRAAFRAGWITTAELDMVRQAVDRPADHMLVNRAGGMS